MSCPNNIAIVYCSQTGFTKRYADWLAKDLGCTAIPYSSRAEVNLSTTDVLVFCSWFHAAYIKGSKWPKKAMREHPGLRVVVLTTGATPMPCETWPESGTEEAFARTFPPSEYPGLPHFYCHGGFYYDRLGAPDKLAMRMFFKMHSRAAETDPKAAEMMRVMAEGIDGTKREHLEPLLNYLRDLA